MPVIDVIAGAPRVMCCAAWTSSVPGSCLADLYLCQLLSRSPVAVHRACVMACGSLQDMLHAPQTFRHHDSSILAAQNGVLSHGGDDCQSVVGHCVPAAPQATFKLLPRIQTPLYRHPPFRSCKAAADFVLMCCRCLPFPPLISVQQEKLLGQCVVGTRVVAGGAGAQHRCGSRIGDSASGTRDGRARGRAVAHRLFRSTQFSAVHAPRRLALIGRAWGGVHSWPGGSRP